MINPYAAGGLWRMKLNYDETTVRLGHAWAPAQCAGLVANIGRRAPYGKMFKILLRKFSPRRRSTCCVKISWLTEN